MGMSSAGWHASLLVQRVRRGVTGPAAGHEQPVDALRADHLGDLRDGSLCRAHSGSCRARRRSGRHPPVTSIQSDLADVAVAQAAEPVADSEHRVAAVERQPHGRPHRRVHPGRRAAAVDDGQAEPRPARRRRPRRGLLHRHQDLVGVAEAPPAQQHRALEVLGLDPLGDGLGLRDAVHQRRADDLVAADPDQLRHGLGASVSSRSTAAWPSRPCSGSGRTRSATRRAARGRGS